MNNEICQCIHILLVEDNPGDVRLLRDDLEEARVYARMSVVEDGEAALEFLGRQGRFPDADRPDLVLLDIRLPRISGLEVLAEMKRDEGLSAIPVIMLTTSCAERDITAAYSGEADFYLTKPLDVVQLIDIVKSIDGYRLAFIRLPAGDKTTGHTRTVPAG